MAQKIDDSLAKQELCLQWGSQAGDWEPETKFPRIFIRFPGPPGASVKKIPAGLAAGLTAS
jgi:hypothetical protein